MCYTGERMTPKEIYEKDFKWMKETDGKYSKKLSLEMMP